MLRLKFKKKLKNSLRDFMIFITKRILNRKLIEQLMRQLRRIIVTKRDVKSSKEKSLIVDNKIDVNLRHKCERFYETF